MSHLERRPVEAAPWGRRERPVNPSQETGRRKPSFWS
jgi:hypothetical protein